MASLCKGTALFEVVLLLCEMCHWFSQHGSRRWDDGRTSSQGFRELGVTMVTPKDAARLHSDLRAAQVKVVAARRRWAFLLRETDTVSDAAVAPEIRAMQWHRLDRHTEALTS